MLVGEFYGERGPIRGSMCDVSVNSFIKAIMDIPDEYIVDIDEGNALHDIRMNKE